VIVDTASELTWVQCAPCESCHDQQGPLFDPSSSPSYAAVPCNSSSCDALQLAMGGMSGAAACGGADGGQDQQQPAAACGLQLHAQLPRRLLLPRRPGTRQAEPGRGGHRWLRVRLRHQQPGPAVRRHVWPHGARPEPALARLPDHGPVRRRLLLAAAARRISRPAPRPRLTPPPLAAAAGHRTTAARHRPVGRRAPTGSSPRAAPCAAALLSHGCVRRRKKVHLQRKGAARVPTGLRNVVRFDQIESGSTKCGPRGISGHFTNFLSPNLWK